METLVSRRLPVREREHRLRRPGLGALKAVGVLLEYPAPPADAHSPPRAARSSMVRAGTAAAAARDKDSGRLAIGFIGAGNYASSMLLPHLARLERLDLAHVATTRSLSAVNAQRRFGFATASTNADAVFEDASLDAIFIVTRHHSHASLVCRALETGKAVFVEKPLALTRDEVDRVVEAIATTGNDRLMVGFNRRFAPLLDADERPVRAARRRARSRATWSTRGRWPPTAGTATTRWKARGSSARAATSSTR